MYVWEWEGDRKRRRQRKGRKQREKAKGLELTEARKTKFYAHHWQFPLLPVEQERENEGSQDAGSHGIVGVDDGSRLCISRRQDTVETGPEQPQEQRPWRWNRERKTFKEKTFTSPWEYFMDFFCLRVQMHGPVSTAILVENRWRLKLWNPKGFLPLTYAVSDDTANDKAVQVLSCLQKEVGQCNCDSKGKENRHKKRNDGLRDHHVNTKQFVHKHVGLY